MPIRVCTVRLVFLVMFTGLMAMMPFHAKSAETSLFEATDAGYSFQYLANFSLDREQASGDVVGVTASSVNNGDVSITFLGPWNPGDLPEPSEQTRQSIVDEFTKSIAVSPKIKMNSSSMTTMLGKPAVDIVFLNSTGLYPPGKGVPAINRYVFTVVDGKAYNFRCVYREDKAAEFGPACDLAVSTVKFGGSVVEPSAQSSESTAVSGCNRKEFNKLMVQVVELSSMMINKDQSPAAIARLQETQQKVIAIEQRSGDKLSEKDCSDLRAIAETLK